MKTIKRRFAVSIKHELPIEEIEQDRPIEFSFLIR